MSECLGYCTGAILGCGLLILRIISIGTSGNASTMIRDDDFNTNCIQQSNTDIIQPQNWEMAAMMLLPMCSCVLGCILACIISCCEDCGLKLLAGSLIIEILSYGIFFIHLTAYLNALEADMFSNPSYDCVIDNNFISATEWTRAGLIASLIYIGLGCCGFTIYCCILMCDGTNYSPSYTKPTNTNTEVVLHQTNEPKKEQNIELTEKQLFVVSALFSLTKIEKCGFCLATDNNKGVVLRSLQQQTPSGSTALRDAILQGMNKMIQLKDILDKFKVIGHKFIHIVLTDGMDNSSECSKEQIKIIFQLIGDKFGSDLLETHLIGIDLGYEAKKDLQIIADNADAAAELHLCNEVQMGDVFERIKINIGVQRSFVAATDGVNAAFMSEERWFLRPELQKFLVLFSLDKSGSMNGKRWNLLQNAVSAFLDGLCAADFIGCVLFNDKVECITE